MTRLIALIAELADLLGQLRRRDYGRHTLANVLAQILAYVHPAPSA